MIRNVRRAAEAGKIAAGTVDSWLVYRLTGGRRHVTDISNASRIMLFDIQRGEWSDELLEAMNLPRAMLPEVCPSSGIIGETSADIFGSPIPIAGIAGDQQAALFGQRCTHRGMVKNTYGTGCFLLMNTGRKPARSASGLLTTVAWRLGRDPIEYALEGSVFVAGAVVQWLRDGLGIVSASSEVEALARQAPDNGGVYFVPAFAGLGAPHWDPNARGVICGLTRGSTAAHLARAALESIAYQTVDVVRAMEKDSGLDLPELRVDGGASTNDLLMQFQADVLGTPVVRPRMTETTALGAAYLAGLAVGLWKSTDSIGEKWQIDRAFEPRIGASQRDRLLSEWARALQRARDWQRPEGG